MAALQRRRRSTGPSSPPTPIPPSCGGTWPTITTISASYLCRGHRLDEARRAFEQARAIQEAIVAANPEDFEFPNDLATSLANIGQIDAASTGQVDRALPLYEQSLALRSKLAAANPDDINARSKLAWTHHNIGMLHAETGRPAERRSGRWSGPTRSGDRWSRPTPT